MFLGIAMHNIDYDTKENTIYTKDKSERQHIPLSLLPSRKIGDPRSFFQGGGGRGFFITNYQHYMPFYPPRIRLNKK